MRLLGVLVVLAACGGGSPGGPAPDAADGSGSSGRLGLFVAWEAVPQLPGPVTEDLTTSRVELQVRSLQFLSDQGDASRSNIALRWDDTIEPDETTFPTAPAGLYSQVSIHLGGGADPAYRIAGTWRDGGTTRPFRVEDATSAAVNLECNRQLAAAGSTEIAIAIDLREALMRVDFRALPVDGTGASVLDDQSDPPQLDDFRKRMIAAFHLDD